MPNELEEVTVESLRNVLIRMSITAAREYVTSAIEFVESGTNEVNMKERAAMLMKLLEAV